MLKLLLNLCFIPGILGWMQLPTVAQITPDTSLGTEQSRLSPNNIIEGGARRGANLFHSFSEFNINDQQRIDFANPTGIDRILARVTGNTRSQILGTLSVLGKADLFLLNPNGIVFGANARLDLSGSFVASTSDSVVFEQGLTFSSRNPQAPPLLTISTPIGLQAGRQPATIAVQGATLTVPPGKTLSLIGGNVEVDGAILSAPEGRVELGSLAGSGVVEFDLSRNPLSFRFSDTGARADIRLNAAQIFVDAGDKGDVVLNARNIQILNQSFIGAGILNGLSINNRAGNITLNASEAIAIQGDSNIVNSVAQGSVGIGGNIEITTGTLLLNQAARITAVTSGQGRAGNVTVWAKEGITIDGQTETGPNSRIFSGSAPGGIGDGGDVTISATDLSVVKGGVILASVFGTGKGGNVDVQVQGKLSVDGVNPFSNASGIASRVALGGNGNGGNLQITTGSLEVTNGGALSVSTNGQGDAGNLTIRARGTVRFDGESFFDDGAPSISRASNQVQSNGIGNAGTIDIRAASIALSNGAQISSSTFGQGAAGNVNLNAQTMVFDGLSQTDFASGVSSGVEGAIGQGGNLVLRTESLVITNGAVLNTTTNGQGNAGNIDVFSKGSVLIAGSSPNQRLISGVFGRINPDGVGQGGNITVTAESLTIRDRARLSTSTQGQGNAGTIRVNARDTVSLVGEDNLTTSSGIFSDVTPGAIGKGGDIFVNADRIAMQRNARISVASEGDGQAGNIQIRAHALKLSQGSRISAETTSNQGGDILLDVRDVLLLRRSSQISTTAGTAQAGGDGGNMDITARFLIAVPNEDSNITANAFSGRGGNITITTQKIFGIDFRDRQTDFSDITASSQFGINGIVTLNTLAIDPTQGTSELPTRFSAPPIAQGCQTSSRTSRFVNQGRGGVSPSPADPLVAETIWQDWELINRHQTSHPPEKIVEAQGWIKHPNGAVTLVVQSNLAMIDCALQPIP